jgi:hypothetical protein
MHTHTHLLAWTSVVDTTWRSILFAHARALHSDCPPSSCPWALHRRHPTGAHQQADASASLRLHPVAPVPQQALFTECSLKVYWMFTECSLNALMKVYPLHTAGAWACYPNKLNVYWTFTDSLLQVRWMFTECSLNVPVKVYPLHGAGAWIVIQSIWAFTEILPIVHWNFTEYSLNFLWMLP